MKSIRVVSYAINGRGLGHLTRQLAILRWMRRYCGVLGVRFEGWVLTSSEADTLARREGFPALKIPSKSMLRDAGIDPARILAVARGWVLQTVAGLQPDLLVVDTFPGGTFGEMLATLEIVPKRALVARPVKDEIAADPAYQALLPLYHDVVVPDDGGSGPILLRERSELEPRELARKGLGIPEGQRAVWLTLGGGGDPAVGPTLTRLVPLLQARGWHVVVGAGPLYQGPELRGPGVTWMDRYVPVELFSGLDAAVSAGGYNAFHELMHAGVPTVFLPQPRIADDQAGRVDKAVRAGAGRRALRIEDVPSLLDDPGTSEAARALVPHNGAGPAAARLLSLVLDKDDVAAAVRAFPPQILGRKAVRDLDPLRLVELLRLTAGDSPAAWASRRATALSFVERGDLTGKIDKARPEAAAVERFFDAVEAQNLRTEAGLALLQALARRFPGASPADHLAAFERVVPALAAFDDWMGSIALIKAVPAQRAWSIHEFTRDFVAWVATETDPFEAQRRMLHTEGGGQRTASETLRILAGHPPAAAPAATDAEEAP